MQKNYAVILSVMYQKWCFYSFTVAVVARGTAFDYNVNNGDFERLKK